MSNNLLTKQKDFMMSAIFKTINQVEDTINQLKNVKPIKPIQNDLIDKNACKVLENSSKMP